MAEEKSEQESQGFKIEKNEKQRNMKKTANLNVMAHIATLIIAVVALIVSTNTVKGCQPSSNPTDDGQGGTPTKAPIVGTSGLVDLTAAAESSVNSVVYIKVTINSKTQSVEYYNPFEDFFGDIFGNGSSSGSSRRQVQTPKRTASASGVIISSDGYIVTNNHVVQDADEISVKLNDNTEYKARIIGTDDNTDLALIKIEGSDFPAIPIGNSDDLKIGEWVLAVGNPFNLTSTVTAGIISAKSRSLHANSIESFIQTDAAINQGNSGGALVNARGELVGINAMLTSPTGSYTGYGFAIPTSIMTKVVEDLKTYGTVQRAMLGIAGTDVSNYIDSQREKEDKEVDLGTTEGVYVSEVSADGAAAEAGLKEGDVITHAGGKKTTRMAELQEELASHHPGDKISITYMRDKKSYTVELTLRNVQGTTETVKQLETAELGVSLTPVSEELKKQLNLSYGLMVNAVTDGKMKDAGVTKGIIIMQVNNKRMETAEDFDEAVREANMTTERVLWIRARTQSGRNISFAIELGEE